MKDMLRGVAVTALLTVPAAAADIPARMPAKAPAAPLVVVYNWSGFYMGGHGGWGRGDLDTIAVDAGGVPIAGLPVLSQRADGFIAGGHLGFNWQWNQIVLGAEIGGSWAEIDDSRACLAGTATPVCNIEIERLFRAGGRLGFAANNWLVYGTGGWARARVATTRTPAINDAKADHNGWYAGAGVEVGFTPNWVFGVEGFRVELDDRIHGVAPTMRRVEGDFWVIQGRLSYKFGFGSTVVARY